MVKSDAISSSHHLVRYAENAENSSNESTAGRGKIWHTESDLSGSTYGLSPNPDAEEVFPFPIKSADR